MSGDFVHVDERGTLSPALTEQFLPARAAILKALMIALKSLFLPLAVLLLSLESDWSSL
jgi:hypothetical protein